MCHRTKLLTQKITVTYPGGCLSPRDSAGSKGVNALVKAEPAVGQVFGGHEDVVACNVLAVEDDSNTIAVLSPVELASPDQVDAEGASPLWGAGWRRWWAGHRAGWRAALNVGH